jgi:hypothetical protein
MAPIESFPRFSFYPSSHSSPQSPPPREAEKGTSKETPNSQACSASCYICENPEMRSIIVEGKGRDHRALRKELEKIYRGGFEAGKEYQKKKSV